MKALQKLPASCTKAQGCASANELTLPNTNFIAVIRPRGYPKPWGKYKSKQLHLSPPRQAKPSLSLGVCYRHRLHRNAAAVGCLLLRDPSPETWLQTRSCFQDFWGSFQELAGQYECKYPNPAEDGTLNGNPLDQVCQIFIKSIHKKEHQTA